MSVRAPAGPGTRGPAHRMSRRRLSVTARSRNSYVGWRRDPNTPLLQRWWDGNDWTAVVRPRCPTMQRTARKIVCRRSVDRLSLSHDAKRALLILLVASCVYAIWGYQSYMAAVQSSTKGATSETAANRGAHQVVNTESGIVGTSKQSSPTGENP